MRALLVGLFALLLVTQAAAATTKADAKTQTIRTPAVEQRALTLDEQLAHKLAALRKYRGTVAYFENHRTLLVAEGQPASSRSKLAYARKRVRQLTRTVASLRAKIRVRETRRLASLPPRKAICVVFGSYCHEAIEVAWCESRMRTTAQNGQYLGLFQMGSFARQLFGHGDTAHEQAVAAHRYFVRSGRDWSPWSCRWAAA